MLPRYATRSPATSARTTSITRLVGHSLAASSALDLASRHPELVGRLVIVDSLPFLPAATNPSATPASMRAVADTIRSRMASVTNEAFEQQQRGMLGR